MPQTVQILRTITNNAPTSLLPGELSAELGGETKLWIGATAGNRLLISTDPDDAPAAGNNFLPLTGGVLSGRLTIANPSATTTAMNSLHLLGVGTGATGGAARVLLQTASNSSGKLVLGMFNTTQNAGSGIWGNAGAGSIGLHFSATDINGVPVGATWMRMMGAAGSMAIQVDVPMTLASHPLTLALEPTQPTDATNKEYVDAGDAANYATLANYLPLIGGDMLGAINLPLAPTADANATSKHYVDLQDAILQEQIDLLTDNLVFSGQIDASTDNGTYTEASGIPDGPLPEPVASLKGFYVIVNTGGQPPLGNIPPGTYARGDWIICDGTVWVELHLGLTSVIAPEVALSPSIPNLGANVQTGLTYLQANYLPRSGGAAFAMTGGLNFGAAYAPGGPTDLSRHISLYQPGALSTGISVTSGRMNYVSPGLHVFMLQSTEAMLIGGATTVNVPLVANSTVTLSADPLLNLQAATKQYVDAAVADSITAVVPDGVSIVGDGTPESPLECWTLDAGTY